MIRDFVKMECPDEDELKERLETARAKLFSLQMQLKEHKLPVLILMEGYGSAGKGSVIGKVIKNIDPRFFKVFTMDEKTEEEMNELMAIVDRLKAIYRNPEKIIVPSSMEEFEQAVNTLKENIK